jgi:hypothetical protein
VRATQKEKVPLPMAKKRDAARCGHYIFPHVVLRQFAFSSPYMCMGALGAPEGQGLLTEMLAAVADFCQSDGEEMSLAADQLRMHTLKIKRKPGLIVELPEPHAATEVYFVGIVLTPPLGDTAADLTSAAVRYFTLEKGQRSDGKGRTVLCEWSQDNKHLNYGDGPAASVKKFAEAIAEKCG